MTIIITITSQPSNYPNPHPYCRHYLDHHSRAARVIVTLRSVQCAASEHAPNGKAGSKSSTPEARNARQENAQYFLGTGAAKGSSFLPGAPGCASCHSFDNLMMLVDFLKRRVVVILVDC